MPSAKGYALRYAEQGWKVLPLREGGKAPATKHGVKDATTDANIIHGWWDDQPHNVGIATGRGSGIVVVDVDDVEAWKDFLGKRTYHRTTVVETPRGYHFYFQCPDGGLGNSVGKLAPGVDVRGDGGYVVAPPSRLRSGGEYEWRDKAPPVPMPEWLLEELRQPDPEPLEEAEDEGVTAYGRTVLDSEVSRLLAVEEGSRNDTLFRCAVRIFELVKAGEIPHDQALGLLRKATKPWEHEDHPVTSEERERTIRSAWQQAVAKPPEPLEDEPVREPGRVLSIPDLADIPPPSWLIPAQLPEGLTMIFGEAGTGKSFVALDWSLSLAAHGLRVMYCAGEGASGLRYRIDSWVEAHPHLDPSDCFRVLAFGAFPDLSNERSVDQLRHDLKEAGGSDLIVIDTWERALAGHNPNDTETVTGAIRHLDQLRAEFDSSVLVLHHPKQSQRGGGPPREKGNNALRNAADCVWRAFYSSKNGNRWLINQPPHGKMKDHEEQETIEYRLKGVGPSCVVSPSSSDVLERA